MKESTQGLLIAGGITIVTIGLLAIIRPGKLKKKRLEELSKGIDNSFTAYKGKICNVRMNIPILGNMSFKRDTCANNALFFETIEGLTDKQRIQLRDYYDKKNKNKRTLCMSFKELRGVKPEDRARELFNCPPRVEHKQQPQ